MVQITLNICRTHIKKRGYLKNKAILISVDDMANEIEVDAKYLPESILDEKENRKIILEVINALPSRQRLVMLLFYFENYSLKELSGQLDMAVSTVKVTLHKGRNKIKEELKGKLGFEETNKGVVGIGFLLSEYGLKILGTEDVSSQVVEETWQNIKAKLFNYALVSMIFFSFSLMLLGQKSGFLEAEKHFQEAFNPLGTVTRNVDIASPKIFPLAEKTVVNQIKEQELQLQLQTLNKHKATINNTAYVNGQPTNTVSIA